jgi:hypothetical protein
MTGYIIQELPVRRSIVFPYFVEVEVVELRICLEATLLVFADALSALAVYG